jgi:Protein of unknown function (DUF3570)
VKLLCVLLLLAAPAAAEERLFEQVLAEELPLVIDSFRVRFTHFDQQGRGWQSQAGAAGLPGSEQAAIEQPQLEVIAHQGPRLTHRLWVPFDVVTAASPDAVDDSKDPTGRVIDTVSSASRYNEAGSMDLMSTYQLDPRTTLSVRSAFHLEEVFRSWSLGGGATRSFADDNAVLSVSLNQVLDWFDRFDIHGNRIARAFRSSTNANLGFTQLLSPDTIVSFNYGVTIQSGELGNTWNAVPLPMNMYGPELLPRERQRHAFVGRLAEYLPWKGAMKLFYRFYVDDWGLQAHTAEAELMQRVLPWLYLRGNYRFHWQSGVSFYTQLGGHGEGLRTADSDLAPFTAQTLGILAAVDVRFVKRLRDLHLDFGYERYFRSNSLTANIYTCSAGFRF